MRNIAIGVCALGFFLLVLMTGYTVTARSMRTTELENAAVFALEQAMERLEYNDSNAPKTDEELVALFEQLLFVQLEAKADYEVFVLDVDCDAGLLSVEVVEHYRHLTGGEGTVSVKKLILLDRESEDESEKTVTLTYFLGEEIYRRYELSAGSTAVLPAEPFLQTGEFLGWSLDENGTIYTETEIRNMILTEDLIFDAKIAYE